MVWPIVVTLMTSIMTVLAILVQCSKKKTAQPATPTGTDIVKPADNTSQAGSAAPEAAGKEKSSLSKNEDKADNKPKPNNKVGVADTHDPNYQTMAGMVDNFGDDRKKKEEKDDGKPKAPAVGGVMADTHDPNYQTLANVEDKFAKKNGAGATAPADKGVAGTQDPNYQTLANVGDNKEVFGKDKKEDNKDKVKAPEEKDKKAGTHDPNYMTMAGLAKNDEVFGNDKKDENKKEDDKKKKDEDKNKKVEEKKEGKDAPKAPEDKNKKAAVHDPNYMTMAGLGKNDEVFGNDKKDDKKNEKEKEKDDKKKEKEKESKGEDDKKEAKKEEKDDKEEDKKEIKTPEDKNKKAHTHDPNYMTMANMGKNDDIFGKDKKDDKKEDKKVDKKEKKEEKKEEKKDDKKDEKKEEKKDDKKEIKTPEDKNKKAHTHDPNYMTMANMAKNDEVFGKDKTKDKKDEKKK